MEIIVVFLWERGWLPIRLERYIWNDLVSLGATEVIGAKDTYELIKIMGSYSNYKRIFVEGRPHPQRQIITDYIHPDENVLYIFGNSRTNNLSLVEETDDVLYIPIDNENILPWAITIAGIVLYDRRLKDVRYSNS